MSVLSVLTCLFVLAISEETQPWSKEFTKDCIAALDPLELFGQWKDYFNKNYQTNEQYLERYGIWYMNLLEIADHNSNNTETYKKRLNQFGDMTGAEFKAYVKRSGIQSNPHSPKHTYEKYYDAIPSSVDWTTQGVVTPVKDQGNCGSCWAFSTTGSLECNYAIAGGNLNSLSEQQLVDCDKSDYGCSGGLYTTAFDYTENNGGLCLESEYPYLAHNSHCDTSVCTSGFFDDLSGYHLVEPLNSTALEAQSAQGCVAVYIEADQTAFQFYSSGVLTGTCGVYTDHAVLVVGYGNLNGQDYWNVKNSWGTDWGVQGYVYICRNCQKNCAAGGNACGGECGILTQPGYPYFN